MIIDLVVNYDVVMCIFYLVPNQTELWSLDVSNIALCPKYIPLK
jgi:hypothetical protein